MKILVIPDVHEDLDFLDAIDKCEDFNLFDHIVCLGDYFDPRISSEAHDQQLVRIAREIKHWKNSLGNRLHLLYGNHDLPYYALRPDCVDSENMSNRQIGYAMSCTTLERAKIINCIWDEAFWRSLKGGVLLDGHLFSHAGVHPVFWPEAPTVEESFQRFTENWRQAFDSIYVEQTNPLFSIGKARKGAAPFGGPLWMDWSHEFIDALDVPQIVGHTRWPDEPVIGRSRCIDMGQLYYYTLTNGFLKEHKSF